MRFPRVGQWVEADSRKVLLADVHAAKGFWQRFLGLQFAAMLPEGVGVLLKDCRSVHTFWMRFSIDVVFLDEDFRVVETHEAIRPWRIVVPKSKSVRHVMEANPGVLSNLEVGAKTGIE